MKLVLAPLRRRAALGLGAAALAPSMAARAARPTRMITPAAVGSSPDLAARLLAEGLARLRGHPIAVENRTGADGTLAAAAYARAMPGEALFFTYSGALTVAPLLHPQLDYDPEADFVPLSSAADDAFALSVSADLPARNLAELVTLASQRPGQLNWFAAPGAPYLAFRAFMRDRGLDLTYVSYRGAPPALMDLAAGRIQVALAPMAPSVGPARDGRIRMIVATTRARSPAAPGLPTTAEEGMPGLHVQGLLGLLGWRGMPAELRDEISAQTRELLAEPAIDGRLRAAGMTPRGSTPAAFAAELRADRTRWAGLAREFGLHAVR